MERDLVASELRGKFKELAQNKYSKVLQESSPLIPYPSFRPLTNNRP